MEKHARGLNGQTNVDDRKHHRLLPPDGNIIHIVLLQRGRAN